MSYDDGDTDTEPLLYPIIDNGDVSEILQFLDGATTHTYQTIGGRGEQQDAYFVCQPNVGASGEKIDPQAFVRMNRYIQGNIGADMSRSGTTSSIAYFDGDNLHAINAGDSPIILIRTDASGNFKAAEVISANHNLRNNAERNRIQNHTGARISENGAGYRLLPYDKKASSSNGLLITRAIGDTEFTGISYEPEIRTEDLDFAQGDRYFVIACSDGLLPHIDREQAVLVTHFTTFLQNKRYSNIAKELVTHLSPQFWREHPNDIDNITALVTELQLGQPIAMGVFDGHGEMGGEIAKEAARFAEHFIARYRDIAITTTEDISPSDPTDARMAELMARNAKILPSHQF
jgi:serine/threonine protein phosphatase PrpC